MMPDVPRPGPVTTPDDNNGGNYRVSQKSVISVKMTMIGLGKGLKIKVW